MIKNSVISHPPWANQMRAAPKCVNSASNGIVFSREQRVTLQNSLTVIKAQYNFSRIKFWGKITGLKDDYFIAQGYRRNMNDYLQTLYSLNGADWCILEEVDEKIKGLALKLRGRFIGDPSFAYDCIEPDNNEESNNTNNQNSPNFGQGDNSELRILEESRLSAVVSEISKQALVFPRNSICIDSGRLNLQWTGMNMKQALELSNWCDGSNQPITEISEKYWSIQQQMGAGVDCVHVVFRNLLWLGAIAFHTVETDQFGNIYVGTGEYRDFCNEHN